MGLQEVSTKGPRGRNVQHGWHHASCIHAPYIGKAQIHVIASCLLEDA